jgi:hypothetical protein
LLLEAKQIPGALVRLEELGKLKKNPNTPSEIEPVTLRLVAYASTNVLISSLIHAYLSLMADM